MNSSIYQAELIEHAEHPKNFGSLAKADATGRKVNATCGDEVTFELRFDNDRVAQVAFNGSGCSVSQAWASLLTEWVKGKTRDELKAFSTDQHLALLDVPLTPSRRPCALLSHQALQTALEE